MRNLLRESRRLSSAGHWRTEKIGFNADQKQARFRGALEQHRRKAKLFAKRSQAMTRAEIIKFGWRGHLLTTVPLFVARKTFGANGKTQRGLWRNYDIEAIARPMGTISAEMPPIPPRFTSVFHANTPEIWWKIRLYERARISSRVLLSLKQDAPLSTGSTPYRTRRLRR